LLIVTGFEALPEKACPICAEEPLNKAGSDPSSSLRTTVLVFLRHAEKRYKDALALQAKQDEEHARLEAEKVYALAFIRRTLTSRQRKCLNEMLLYLLRILPVRYMQFWEGS
jgi:hypothetical protein